MSHSILSLLPIDGTTCVECWNDNLYLGTTDGEVIHFVTDPSTETMEPSYLMASRQMITPGKRVENILLLPQVLKAAVFCNSTLSFFSLPEFTPGPTTKITNVVGFCRDFNSSSEDSSIILVTYRKFVRLVSIGEKISLVKTIDYPNGVIAGQQGSFSCVANSTSYDLLDLDKIRKSQITTILQDDNMLPLLNRPSLKPLIAPIGTEEFLITSGSRTGDQSVGSFVDINGDSTRGVLVFEKYPLSIAVDYPYVVALRDSSTIEMHSLVDLRLVQVISSPSIEAISLSRVSTGAKVTIDKLATKIVMRRMDETPISNEELDAARRISTVTSRFFINGRRNVSCLFATPLLLRVEEFLRKNQPEEAIRMAEEENKTITPENIHAERVYHEQNYIFQACGFLYFERTLFDDAKNLFERGNIDPRLLIALFPEFAVKADEVMIYQGLRAIIHRMKNIDDIVDENLSRNYDPHLLPSSSESLAAKELRAVLRRNALEMLLRYLLAFRDKKGFGSIALGSGSENVFYAVELVVLKILLSLDKNEVKGVLYKLIDSGLDCSTEAESLLKDNKRYFALSILYKSQKNQTEVVSTWKNMIDGTWPDDEFNDGERQLKNYLIQRCKDTDLMWESAVWLMQRNPVYGAQVLLNLSQKGNPVYSLDMIIDKVKKESQEGYEALLQLLIDSGEQKFRKDLLEVVTSDIFKLLQDPNVQDGLESHLIAYKQLPQPKPSYLVYLHDDLSTTFSNSATNAFTAKRRVFRLLLNSTPDYDADNILKQLEPYAKYFVSERVMLFQKSGRHGEALAIFTHDLNDYDGAEKYCIANTSLENPSIELFNTLLDQYLDISDYSLQFEKVSSLLNSQGRYFDPTTVLSRIPDNWTIEVLSAYLFQALRKLVREKREAQIMKSVCFGDSVNAAVQWVDLAEQSGVSMTEETLDY